MSIQSPQFAALQIQLKAVDDTRHAMDSVRRGLSEIRSKQSYLNKTNKAAAAYMRKKMAKIVRMNEVRLKNYQATLAAERKEQQALKRKEAQWKRLNSTILAVGLSALFTGIALRRFTDRALRGLFNTFEKVQGETGQFNQLTNQLRANWEFFKFTLMDALMQTGLYTMFINFLVTVIRWMSDWPDWVKASVVALTVALAGLAAVLAVGGQLMLGIAGFRSAVAGIGTDALLSNSRIETLKTGLRNLAGLAAIGMSIYWAKETVQHMKDGTYWKAAVSALQAGTAGVGGLRALQRRPGAGPLIAIAVALELVQQNRFVSTIVDFFLILGNIIHAAFRGLVDSISHTLEGALYDPLISALNTIRSAFAALRIPTGAIDSAMDRLRQMQFAHAGDTPKGFRDWFEEGMFGIEGARQWARSRDEAIQKALDRDFSQPTVNRDTYINATFNLVREQGEDDIHFSERTIEAMERWLQQQGGSTVQ